MGYLLMRREEIMKTTMINKILSVLAVFFFCLTTFTAGAATLKSDLTIYFDVTNFGDFSGKDLQIMIGHGSYSTTYKMNKVTWSNNLYSVNIGEVNSGDDWGGATQLGFMAASGIWGPVSDNDSNKSPEKRIKFADVKTGIYKVNEDLSGNVLFKITNKANKSIDVTKDAVSYYITGITGNNKIKMTYDKNSNEYYKKDISVKSTDAVKVRLEIGGESTEYKTLEDGSCATSASSGITMQDGIYDFYFKLSNDKLYVGVNESNPTKYYIMGTFDNWTTGIEINVQNPGNTNEVMLQCLEITDDNTQIKIKEQRLCEGTWINAVSDGSVVEKPSGDNNIVLNKGFYAFYYNFNDHKLYIGYSTPTSCYLVGTEGGDKVMTLKDNQYVLKNIEVKSTDKVKVKLVYDCGNIEYVDLDGASCSTVESTPSGITFSRDGYYDFYFKSDKTIYVGANESNPANADKYYLMGVNGDWDNGIELKASNENDYELVLLGQEISKTEDAIKIVKKTPCGDEFYADVKIDSPVVYSGGGTGENPPNIVLEDGIYDFYFDKDKKQIYIGGELDKANVVYLDPKVEDGNDWEVDGARFAVYYFNDKTSGWVSADKCGGLYFAYIPAEYGEYIWVRIMKDGSNNWDDRWNQTGALKYDKDTPLTMLIKPSEGYAYDYDSKQTTYTGVCGNNYKDLDCTFPTFKDTVFVHINQFVENDLCNYVFDSFEQAFAVLKTNNGICTSSTITLGGLKEDVIDFTKHVVMLVHFGPEYYKGTEKVGMSGGHVGNAPAIFFRNINQNSDKQLVVRTADPKGNRAVLVHPVIRRSKNIVLDNLDIISDKNLRDNALDIDTGKGDETLEYTDSNDKNFNIVPLPVAPSNITLKNCYVESYGRNGIHIVGIKGLHVENNEFYTKYDFTGSQSVEEKHDVVDWGGTIKFINCTDVKFLRNNSEGTLATSFFIQGCQRVLIMNNVFWNDNKVEVPGLSGTGRTVANVRLVNYVDDPNIAKAVDFPVKNIGVYYNTFFIRSNESSDAASSYTTFDFFRLGGLKQPVIAGNFDPNTIRFQYNNCYSYDADIKGNNDDATNTTTFYLQGIGKSTEWCQCFKYNNFWSAYDKINHKSSSAFEVGKFCVDANETYNAFIDVPSQVCKTDPTRPASLVVKEEGLNIGTLISEKEDVSLQGAHLLFNDRLNPDNGVNSIRPHSSVDNKNESLTPYDKIYKEPGTINLYTSPIVGSQSSDVLITSIKLTPQKSIKLNLVDKEGNSLIDVEECKPLEESRFAITTADGTPICSLTTDNEGNLDDVPVYVTFIRPTGVTVNTTYEAFLIIEPSQDADAQLILTIPIRGHYIAKIESIPGTWTIGAFQQREEMPVDTIVWHGSVSTDWDNRNNWYKTDGTLVTCLDALTEDLTVIIPNKDSEKYITPPDGIYNYPSLPKIASTENFGNVRNNNWNGEQVNAGSPETATQVAKKIYMEYGSALVGVEELGDKRYSEVESEFVARRNDWLLVGGVVNPFDTDEEGNLVIDAKGNKVSRSMVSGDYFLNHLPHVYMHSANINKSVVHADEDSVGWDESFAALNVEVDPRRVFAIRLPNQYGNTYEEKLPAVVYNRKNQTNYDPKEPYTYKFNGRFYNESKVLYYDGLTPEKPVLLTNTYPANINAYKLQEDKGTIQIYDYNKCSFVAVGNNQNAEILSQHGFLFTPKSGLEALNVAQNYFKNTETGHRSVAEEVLSFRIQLSNNKESVASEVYIRYDELKDDAVDYASDAPKAFNSMIKVLPELYVKRYDKKWSGISIPDISKPIPLGVKMQASNQVLTFSISNVNMPYDIILEDRFAEKTYNLSAGEQCVVDDLVAGNCEGRFYIMLQENATDEEENLGDDVTTDVEDAVESSPMIDIFTNGNQLVVSANNEVELQTIIISDMSGKHQVYNVSGQYVALTVPASTGVYTVNVIGDTTSIIEKVKLN